MDNYRKVDIPESGYGLMAFSPEAEARIRAITAKEEAAGAWKCSRDVKIDLKDEYFWSYWLQKSARPIREPLLGHAEMKDFFLPCRNTRFELNGGPRGETMILAAAGDLMCTKGLEHSKDTLYEDVAPFLFGADIRFANLESTFPDADLVPTSFSSDDAPKINLTPAQYRTLTDYKGQKYDVLQLANNHIIDCGMGGIQRTLEQLERDGIAQVGVNSTEDCADRTTITRKSGLKIGWVSHTMFVNFRPLPEEKPWIVNLTPFHIEQDPDLSQILRQIEYCRKEKCELIVLSLHWGLEFETYPHPDQRRWAQVFADAGVDIILGQHPHVIQYTEIIHPAFDPSKDVPVVYSQGNLTPVLSNPASVLSMLVRFRISRTEGAAKVTGMELLPVALVERVAGEGSQLELKELKKLTAMQAELEEPMQDYVVQMSDYADEVLGPTWRE